MKTPKQLIAKLQAKGITRAQIALACGVNGRTVNNWAAGVSPGGQSEKLLRLFAAEKGVV